MNNNIKVNKLSVTLLRALTSGIFIIAGISGHLINPQRAAARIEQAVFKDFAYFFGDPVWLVIITGVMMTLAGISFLIGFKTKWAAIVLLAVLVPITVTMQIGQMNTLGPLFKNVAITGSLLFFILNDGFQSKVLARPSETAVRNSDLSGER